MTITVANAAATPPAFVQVNAAIRRPISPSVAVTYTGAQTAGNTNILAIGWNNATSNITSVTDSAGNTYQLAVPTARGSRAEPGDLLRHATSRPPRPAPTP